MALKIAVLVKEVPDLEVKVGVSDGGTELEVEDRNVLNFFDELAVEEAVRIRESGLAAEVYCVSAGDGRGNEAARRGLAMGADSAFLVDDAVLANADPLTIARTLAALVEREGYDLVLAGKQSTDDESGLVAAMVAELLGIPCVAGVVELELEEGSARVVREELEGRAHRVLVLTGAELVPYTADSLVAALSAAAEEDEQGLFLFPEGMRAREVLPRLAVRMGGRAVMNAVKLLAEDGELVVTRPVVGGRAYAELLVDEGPWLVAFRPNSFNPDFPADLETEVQSVETDGASSRIEVLEGAGGDVGVVDLAEAQVVVTGGRGMKDPGNLQLLEGLADALNGPVGVSRAVVDAGWAEHAIQVGKSGKTVSPTLYFAFGISGLFTTSWGWTQRKSWSWSTLTPVLP